MTESSVLNGMPEVISIYADRSVSGETARLLHGIEPLIREAQGKGFQKAYLARETIAAKTGLSHSKIIGKYYETQLEEAGVLLQVSQGKFAVWETEGGGMRGIATGWAMSWANWTPGDIPTVDLVTAPYRVSVDRSRSGLARAMSPVSSVWSKQYRAHRLACALLYHVGYQRVLLTKYQAAEILGKGSLTGWRALRDLGRLHLAKETPEGWWVDLSSLFYNPEDIETSEDALRLAEEHQLIRSTVFRRDRWDLRSHARMCRETLAQALAAGHVVRPDYAAVVGRSFRQALLYVARDVRDNEWTWGRPVEI